MGGGGGGIIGAALNIGSIFYPPLRPFAMAYNAFSAVENLSQGNILGAVTKGFGAYTGLSGLDAASGMGAADSVFGDNIVNSANYGAGWGNAVEDGIQNTANTEYDLGDADIDRGMYRQSGDQIAYNQNDILEQMGGNANPENIQTVFEKATPTGLGSIFSNSENAIFNAPNIQQAGAANDFLQNTSDLNSQTLAGFQNIPTMGAGGGEASLGQYFGDTGAGGSSSLGMQDTSSLGGDTGVPSAGTSEGTEWGDFSAAPQQQQQPVIGGDAGEYGFSGSQEMGGNMFAPNQQAQQSGGGNIFDKIMKAQQQSPLQQGVKALGGIDSWMQGRKAQDQMRGMYDQAMQGANFNNARGDFANQKWRETFENPNAGFRQEYMMGPGREAVNTLMAKAAKAGKRNSYAGSGMMESDLYGKYLNAQNDRARTLAGGFATPQSAQVASQFAGPMAAMTRNQNAPLFDAANNIFASNRLADIFGNRNSYIDNQYEVA